MPPSLIAKLVGNTTGQLAQGQQKNISITGLQLKDSGRQFSLFIFVILLLTSCKSEVENGILENGHYQVKFDSAFTEAYEDYELEVVGYSYAKYFENGEKETGILEKVDEDAFIMRADSEEFKSMSQDSLSEFQKILLTTHDAWGPICMDIEPSSNDTIPFVTRYSRQVHVIITSSGLLIRK